MGSSTTQHGTLAEVLSQHLEAGTIARKNLELAARVTHSTVARWVSGETMPTADQLADMLAAGRLPSQVQRDILDWLTAFSPFHVIRGPGSMTRDELDANHDGRVNSRDAMRHALRAQAECVRLAEELAVAMDDGRITTAELTRLRGLGAAVETAIELAVEAARRDGNGQ